ncbi:MAG: tRNA 2-thiouridine(34) synthase MnmA [Tepidisphaeraceae bacterium]
MSGSHPKVVVAMSGGVDSSVAAALLLRKGFEVIGAFMRLGSPDGVESQSDSCDTSGKHKQGCCSVLDAQDARRVAAALEIPFYVLNFQEEFGRVIDYFVSEYNRGRTPNPCVRCNDWLKFGRLASYARAVGAEYVASGHYARIETDPKTGEARLCRGRDHRKDQSYVLFGISRWALDHTLLPVGEMRKSEVRAVARDLNLPVYNKPDSQEICFVPDQDYAALVKRRSPEEVSEGVLVDASGQILGTHEGHQQFTIGQRRGIGLALGHPVYVVDIAADTNRVTVGSREQLLHSELVADQFNVLDSRLAIGTEVRCTAKIRYNHDPQPAVARRGATDQITVRFDDPQSAITPGQAVVLYDDDVVLGGGWIDRAID